MQFMVLAYDGKEEGTFERRMAVRDDHLRAAKEMYESGKWLYASGILDEEGRLIGSMIVCDFPSRQALQEEWLDNEPYVQNRVWQEIKVHRAQVAPFCAGT